MTALAIALLAVPFLFGVIRFVSTASDWRYVVVAAASTVGASVVVRRRSPAGKEVIRLVAAIAVAALVAALAAVAVGARSRTSVAVVAISFALCSASGAALWVRSRHGSSGVA